MRKGIRLYKWSVLISGLLSTALLVFLIYQAATGGFTAFFPQGGSFNSGSSLNNTTGVSLNPGGIALQAGEDIAGFAAFIVMVISWSRWRDGIRQVGRSVSEYGPEHQLAARRAKEDYDRTATLFIVIFVAAIIGTIVIAGIAFDLVASQASSNGAAANLNSVLATVLVAVVVLVAVLLVLNFVMYFFSSRSLKNTFYALANEDERNELERARRWVLAGAAIPLVGGILLFIGMYRFQGVYDRWLDGST